jgi:putative holliday junction resolvase
MSGERRRVLGVDPGERRVGLAVSDPLGITAQGLATFDRARGNIIEHVRGLVREYDVECIVVGRPLALSGAETDSTRRAEALARDLAPLNVPVVMWDERLSSVEAQRILAGARAGKDAVDRIAAVLILQGYLDARANSSAREDGDA